MVVVGTVKIYQFRVLFSTCGDVQMGSRCSACQHKGSQGFRMEAAVSLIYESFLERAPISQPHGLVLSTNLCSV